MGVPQSEERVSDAPKLKDDYYLNVLDWGQNNVIAIALGSELYLWNAENRKTQKLMQVEGEEDYLASVAWSEDAKTVAVGLSSSEIQLWDTKTSQLVRPTHFFTSIQSLTWLVNIDLPCNLV